jgi:hypothetical protein
MKKFATFMATIMVSAFALAQQAPVEVKKAATPAPAEKVKKEMPAQAGAVPVPVFDAPPAPAVDVAKPIGEDNLMLAESSYNFGKIAQNKPVTHEFAIQNNGKTELKLDNVAAGCGCTTPQWQPGPYKAGEKAVITVGYNAASSGPFTKTVTITYNGSMTKVITISGEVIPAPVTPAPENKGVQMLKGN